MVQFNYAVVGSLPLRPKGAVGRRAVGGLLIDAVVVVVLVSVYGWGGCVATDIITTHSTRQVIGGGCSSCNLLYNKMCVGCWY